MRKLVVLAAPWALLGPVWGAEVEVSAEVGVGRSDNIARTAVDPIEETIGMVGFVLSAQENRRRLALDVAADLAYQEYLNDTYEGEVIGYFDGSLLLRLAPERLHWTFDDTFGQTRGDLFTPVTPQNREYVNSLSTGPDLLLGVGATNHLRLAARYGRVNYEERLLDNERYSAAIALSRDLSSRTSLSLNASDERVEYEDEPLNPPYNTEAAFLRYEANGARTLLVLDLGGNRVDREGSTYDSPLVRFDLTRLLGRRATLRFTAGSELTDSSAIAGADQEFIGNEGTQSLTSTSEPFKLHYGSLAWDATGRRTQTGIGAAFNRETYAETVTLDRDRFEGQAYIARDVTAGWTLRLSLTYLDEDFRNQPGDYDELTGTLGISRQVASRLRIELSGERSERDAETAEGVYSESRFWLRLRSGERLARTAGLPPSIRREPPITSTEPE